MNFWDTLQKPIIVQAPMEDVTDAAFRYVIAKYGKPQVLYTEFTSADGLAHPKGKERLMHRLVFDEIERPIVMQIFGINPENMYKAAQLAVERGFDGIDINMGCPDKNICKQGTGAALIKNPELAKQLIKETMRGAEHLPVTVKTRLGFTRVDEYKEWLPNILETEPAVLTVHLRTKKEMSKVPAHWELAKDLLELRNKYQPETLLFGNGDIKTPQEARTKAVETGVDGVMIGRGIYGNPWLYGNTDKLNLTLKQILDVLIEHSQKFDEFERPHRNFVNMRKHFKSYISGFPNSKDLFEKLMAAESAEDVKRICELENL